MTHWVTLFDVAAEPFRWGNAGEGLAAVALVALGAAASIALKSRGLRGGATILALAAGVAVFFAVRTVDHRREHDACVEAARRNEGRVIEGTVSDFHPVRSLWRRPWSESFTVNGERVSYPMLAGRCGFHGTLVEPGQIRDGIRVRLREWNGTVLKLEIEPGALVTPSHQHDPL